MKFRRHGRYVDLFHLYDPPIAKKIDPLRKIQESLIAEKETLSNCGIWINRIEAFCPLIPGFRILGGTCGGSLPLLQQMPLRNTRTLEPLETLQLFFSLTPIVHCHILQESLDAGIAQSVEQGTENPRVGGSIPPPGTFFILILQVLKSYRPAFLCWPFLFFDRFLTKRDASVRMEQISRRAKNLAPDFRQTREQRRGMSWP